MSTGGIHAAHRRQHEHPGATMSTASLSRARIARSDVLIVSDAAMLILSDRQQPGPSRIERILGAADAMFERQFTSCTAGRLPPEAVTGLEALIAAGDPDTADGGGVGFLQELKTDPGQLGLETLLNEITELERVKAIGLPPDLFAGASEMLVAGWRARAARMYPSDFAKAPQLTRLTLLAALCWVRKAELADGLVDLLVQLVHKISVRAERKVEGELNSEFRRVHGKQGILFKLAGAAVDHPDEIVRAALYPVVGETTLRNLVAGARANERTFNTRVRVQLRSSYSRHYRRGLPGLLKALTFRSNNTEHKPVMDALELLDRYSDSAEKFYAAADREVGPEYERKGPRRRHPARRLVFRAPTAR